MIPVQPYPSLKGSCFAYVLVTHTMVHTDTPARCPALLSSFTTLGQIYTLISLCFLPPSWRSPGATAFFSVMERSGNSPFALLPAVLMDPSVPGAVFHLLLPYHKKLNMVSTHVQPLLLLQFSFTTQGSFWLHLLHPGCSLVLGHIMWTVTGADCNLHRITRYPIRHPQHARGEYCGVAGKHDVVSSRSHR